MGKGGARGERERGWEGRRWEWGEVGVKCALPMGVVCVVMAWALVLTDEWASVSSLGLC